MTNFEFDCLLRKRLAKQARYRKRGSKSKKCPMSTDHMTNKQWRERCGVVVSISLGKPVSWDNFKELSKATQEEYIKDLMDRYGANATSLAAMFGIRPLTVRRYIASRELDITFPVGHSMNAEQRTAWKSFLGGADCEAEQESSPLSPATAKGQPTTPMSMNKFSLSFSGKIDVSMISNSLLHILGDNASGCIEIVCNLE